MKIWDGFIRVFHWAQALLIPALWWTADSGEMIWHQWLACLLLSLWLVRLLWGVLGSDTARFSQFVYPPRQLWAYLRGAPAPRPGHNPAGGYMVVLLLLVVGLQLLTGLGASDGIFTDGPLVEWLGSSWSDRLTLWHHYFFDLLLILIVVHLLAVAVYRLRGKQLIKQMVTGGMRPDGQLRSARWPLLAVVVLFALLAWWWPLPAWW